MTTGANPTRLRNDGAGTVASGTATASPSGATLGLSVGGKPDAAGVGLLLDDVNFYKDDT
jgi:hypothetical protein